MIDETDRRLLTLLQNDARQTIKGLADQIGTAPSTCLERIRSLQQRRVITGFHAEVDPVAIGRHLQAVVSVRMNPKTDAVLERFIDHVWNLPETLAVTLLSGTDDVAVHLGVSDTDHLRRIVLSEIASHPGVVDERTSLVFAHRRKHNLSVLPGK
jgi:DNA-binding Lrp family transcriptional regulator